jgi:phosphohistidine phosphatase SixA
MLKAVIAFLALSTLLLGARDLRADEAALGALRAGGHAILMRHADAPGGGDPRGFVLGDCTTQRNLSDAGRAQAKRAGDMLKAAGVRIDRLLSSRWCRTLETARLLGVGTVEPYAPLDSFFSDAAAGPGRTAAVAGHLQAIGARTYLLVTHQVNITALTGIFPASGEMIVVKPDAANPGRPTVVGRIR